VTELGDRDDAEEAEDVGVVQRLGGVFGAALREMVAEPHELAALGDAGHQHAALAVTARDERLHTRSHYRARVAR
jgi:hypothetical protein